MQKFVDAMFMEVGRGSYQLCDIKQVLKFAGANDVSADIKRNRETYTEGCELHKNEDATLHCCLSK